MRPVLVLALLLASAAHAEPSDVLGWLRKPSPEVGCIWEQKLGHRDPRFNCALKGYKNAGNPCDASGAYTEGPRLPLEKAKQLHPELADARFEWEGGRLREVTLVLSKRVAAADAFALVGLPRAGKPLPSNVMSADVQECAANASCIVLQGFDHQGAADVDCGSDEETPTQCADEEDVVFSCKHVGEAMNKLTSVCASPSLSAKAMTLYFRSGTKGKAELVYPATATPPGESYWYSHQKESGTRRLRFEKDGATYLLTVVESGKPSAALGIQRKDGTRTTWSCAPGFDATFTPRLRSLIPREVP